MVSQNAKCPKCGKGEMKMTLAPTPLTVTVAQPKGMRAKCNKCGFEEDFKKIYPNKKNSN
jgi:ribosomal protein S27AE